MTLGRKQSSSNDAFLRAYESIEELVPLAVLDKALDELIERLRPLAGKYNTAYGWSGGKDSFPLAFACEKAGIHRCVFAACDLEYPSMIRWIEENKPEGLETVTRTDIDYYWLANPENEKYIFPKTGNLGYFWTSQVTHHGQKKYYRKHNLDLMLFGRRTADGNMCGKEGWSESKGYNSYSPLYDWSHELVLAFAFYYIENLPPLYGWPQGWVSGTSPWPGRSKMGDAGWAVTYFTEPDVVRLAAEFGCAPARDFLDDL